MVMQTLQSSIFTGCLLWSATWLAVPTIHAAEASAAVPETASVVVRWKSPQASVGKLANFVDAVQPGFGGFVRAYLPAAGQWIGIPGLQGVDLDQDFYAIVFFEPQVSPTVVYVLTAKDVDAVEKALSDYEVHASGNVVAYSDDEDSLAEVKERLEGKGKSLWSIIDAASMKTFNDGDISVLVNVKQLVVDYADELEAAEPKLDAAIDQITNALPEDQQSRMGAVFDIYRQLGQSILAALHDTKSFTLGVTIAKDAIRYEDRLQMVDDTPTAKFLGEQPTSDLSLVNKLPASKSLYVGTKFDPTSMTEWSLKMTKNMAGNLSSEQSAQLDAAFKEMSNLKYGEMAVYFDLSDKSPSLRSGSVSTVTPTDRMREISHLMVKAIGTIEMPNMKQTTTLEPNVAKIAGAEVDRITIKQEFENMVDPLGIQKIIQSVFIGNAGMQQHVLYQKNRVLQTLGGGTDELQGLVNSLDSNDGSETAVARSRQRIGEKSNLVAMLDLARLVVNGLKAVGQETQLPFDTKALDKLNLAPSFCVYSLTCEAGATRVQIDLPVTQFQNIAKIVSMLQPQ